MVEKVGVDLDDLDRELLYMMISGSSNAEMAAKTKKPLSTIQRRTRRILEKKLLLTNPRINYKKFGFKNGLLHVYVKNGDAAEIARIIWKLDGIILRVSLHIGNSDIIVEYACKDSEDLVNLITQIKKMDGIDRIVWSEEVLEIDGEPARSIIPKIQAD